MGQRKVFVKTDLSTPKVEHVQDSSGSIVIPLEIIPPTITEVNFGYTVIGTNNFSFTPWYGVGINSITYACQRQIERFLDKQDVELEPTTVYSYSSQGLRNFLTFLSILSKSLERELTLSDIKRQVIDDYLVFLEAGGTAKTNQKTIYTLTKPVLKALCLRGLIFETLAGDDATFPRNPFPNAAKQASGEHPLTKAQRNAFAMAVKNSVLPIFSNDVEPTSELLSYALLIIALHTGRNTSPLLELSPDCLRAHPKNNTMFLVLYKRRGHSTSKVAIRADMDRDLTIESLPTIRPTVVRLISRIQELSKRLREEAPEHLRNSVWLFRMQTSSRSGQKIGSVSALNSKNLARSIQILVTRHKLTNSDGHPLRINVSRLRKTFINRVFDILDGDVPATAAAAGNTVRVTDINYLRPGENARKNWRFMGSALVQELLTNTIGATERTPVGQCSDTKNGDYAPKRDGAVCMEFLNCVRCRNYVVTGDDLYRLFSFYWRILSERTRMPPKRWQRQFAHIVRLIDRDIVQMGVTQRIFTQAAVERERERARRDPHLFWRSESIMENLTGGLI